MDLSPGGLFAALVVSGVGTGVFIYGRKQRRAPQFVAGVLLMACPLVGGPWLVMASGTAVVGALWLAVRMGL